VAQWKDVRGFSPHWFLELRFSRAIAPVTINF